MDKKSQNPRDTQQEQGRNQDNRDAAKDQAGAAHDAAEKDIQDDAEFSAHSPNDDLDEGELARLGENTDLV